MIFRVLVLALTAFSQAQSLPCYGLEGCSTLRPLISDPIPVRLTPRSNAEDDGTPRNSHSKASNSKGHASAPNKATTTVPKPGISHTSSVYPLNETRVERGSLFQFYNPLDKLPDFSFAGYKSGAEPIPSPQHPIVSLNPTGDQQDRTLAIQTLIDVVGSTGGGVVLLKAGDYWLSSVSLTFLVPNVVLRGEGEGVTNVYALGISRPLLTIGGSGSNGKTLIKQEIVDDYVGVGANRVTVKDTTGFYVGAPVLIERLVTDEWVKAMGMDTLVRDGKKQTWLGGGSSIRHERSVVGIEGNTIYFDVPLTDPIDTAYNMEGKISLFAPPPRVSGIGIERISFILSPSQDGISLSNQTQFLTVASFSASEDCWMKNFKAKGFFETLNFGKQSRRITVQDFVMERDVASANGGHGALALDVTISGSQILLLRGKSVGSAKTGSYVFATGGGTTGPNVVSGYDAGNATGAIIEPHQRWATGFLVESSKVGRLRLRNRNIAGSGQGWAVGTGIAWNCEASELIVQDPPLSRNFAIGSTGTDNLPTGSSQGIISANRPVKPDSLYLAQLQNRMKAVPSWMSDSPAQDCSGLTVGGVTLCAAGLGEFQASPVVLL